MVDLARPDPRQANAAQIQDVPTRMVAQIMQSQIARIEEALGDTLDEPGAKAATYRAIETLGQQLGMDIEQMGVTLDMLGLADKKFGKRIARLARAIAQLRGRLVYNSSDTDVQWGGIMAPDGTWNAAMRTPGYGLPTVPWLPSVAVALQQIGSKCSGRVATGGLQIVQVTANCFDEYDPLEPGDGLVASPGQQIAQYAMGGWWTVVTVLAEPYVLVDLGGAR